MKTHKVITMTSLSLPARHRKVGLAMAGLRVQDVADRLKVDQSLVSRVMQGQRLTAPQAKKVMSLIARLMQVPVAQAFPEYRPKDQERRARSA
jgi:transcriptional regulator with XRE-family HTH domain